MGLLSRRVDSSAINPNFPPLFQRGLPAIGTFALTSVIATCTLFAFISYRMITWRRHYRTFVGRNQYLVLVYNLALADLMQGLSFTISFYWLEQGEIDSNSNWCFGQGFLVHIGDVSSAFFILAIAVHTWFRVVKNRSLDFRNFLYCVISIWIFASLLAILGPITKGKHVFVQSGAWASLISFMENQCKLTSDSAGSMRNMKRTASHYTTSGSSLSSSDHSSFTYGSSSTSSTTSVAPVCVTSAGLQPMQRNSSGLHAQCWHTQSCTRHLPFR